MTQVVLLDLGNVVLGVDFRRVFTAWAESAKVDEQIFHDRWHLGQAYKDHEVGELDFSGYVETLTQQFGVELPLAAWQQGWNNLWTEPFHSVIELLPAIALKYRLCGFTNTNDTHAACWREKYSDNLASFEEIYVSSEIGLRKPDKAAFAYVCDDMSVAPGDVVFLDDTRENATGATAAGLDARHVTTEAEVVETLLSLL